MLDKPIMAKATAVWLVDNTTLSFKQIADEVEVFLNGESVFQNAILRHNEPQIEVDLSDQLVSGTNEIQVVAENGPGSATT